MARTLEDIATVPLLPARLATVRSWIRWFVVLLLGCLALTMGTARAQSAPPYLLQWGSPGSGDGQFGSPFGIAVGHGLVYVADGYLDRMQEFGAAGNFVGKWNLPGSGAYGLSLDRDGSILIANPALHRIQKFSQDGSLLLGEWGRYGDADGEFEFPTHVHVDADGVVWVADTENNRIQKFDSKGAFLGKLGSPGIDDGQFSHPAGIALDEQRNLYVVDRGNRRVEKFGADGTFVTKWGVEGSSSGQFGDPIGIAVDALGHVYVADTGNDRIEMFDTYGNYLAEWGGHGTGDGQFDHPYGLAIDSEGSLYVTDYGNSRVEKFGYPPVSTRTVTWGWIKSLYR